MRLSKWVLAVALMLAGHLGAEAQAPASTFDLVRRAKRCYTQEGNGTIECNYKVGNDLQIVIAGVGEADASINFKRSNAEGDFYASFGLAHGCILVKPGSKNKLTILSLAFISPKNGKVYETWADCQRGL